MNQNGINQNGSSIMESVRLALKEVKEAAETHTVIGEPISVGEVTLIPVSKISIGVGLGGGTYGKEMPNNAGGGGTGLTVSPIAFIVVGKDGETKLLNIGSEYAFASSKISGTVNEIDKALDNVPGIISKVKGIFSKDKSEKTDVTEKQETTMAETATQETHEEK